MSKVVQVAIRELVATVLTKGFIIGVLVTPFIAVITIFAFGKLLQEKPPKIDGELALVDPTGKVADGVRDYLSPEAVVDRWKEIKIPTTPEEMPTNPADAMSQAMPMEVPTFRVTILPSDADVENEKAPLREGTVTGGGRLAVAVVAEDAVEKAEGAEKFGRFELFVREKLDDRIEDEIQDAIKNSIIEARVEAYGYDRDEIEALTRVGRVRSTTVTEEGEQETNEALNMLMPAGFMALLLVSVLTGGQQIMTTTIEEKSNRVVEVLLSAVSPMQLMAGKIIGQMIAGFLILGIYAAMGVSALVAFAVFGLVDPWLFLYLVIFFLIAYFIMGSLMAAIGAAVNELREAQTLMTPVMLTMMLPWILWFPIVREPNSTFSTVISFIPPVNTFAMFLRMTSSAPPPLWQVWASIAIGVAAVFASLWFAAKVFRIGLLMYGKPPTFRTLVRWVRMA